MQTVKNSMASECQANGDCSPTKNEVETIPDENRHMTFGFVITSGGIPFRKNHPQKANEYQENLACCTHVVEHRMVNEFHGRR